MSPAAALLALLLATPVADLDPVWETPVGRLRNAGIVAVHLIGDLLIVEDDRGGATALEVSNGRPRWFLHTGRAPRGLPPAAAAGTLTFLDGEASVVVDAQTGRRLGSVVIDAVPLGVPVSDGRTVFAQTLQHQSVTAYDLETGLERWDFDLPAPFEATPRLVGPPDRLSVLVATADGMLRAIPATARRPKGARWTLALDRVVGNAVDAGRNLVLRDGRTVIAVEAGSGRLLWRHAPAALLGEPAVAGERVLLVAEGRLRALDLATGRIVWEVEPAEGVVGRVGDAVLTGGGRLRRLADGEVLAEGLPAGMIAAGEVLVERRGDTLVALRPIYR